MNRSTTTETSAAVGSWSNRRRLTLVAAFALIIGGITFAHSSPHGFVGVHLIERRIMLGASTMIGGFLLLAVHVLTGILAVQPASSETKS